MNTVNIRYSEFDNLHTGIQLSGMDYAVVVENQFHIGDPHPFSKRLQAIGVILNSASAYQVENNDFDASVPTAKMGILVINSGSEGNEIYKNTFDGLERGIQAQGRNGNVNAIDEGLIFRCNTLIESVLSDISITSGRVAAPQGECQNMLTPANNLFSYNNSFDYWQNNNVFPVEYHYSPSATFNTEPRFGYYNNYQGNTDPIACPVFLTYDPDKSCPLTRFSTRSLVLLRDSLQFHFNKKKDREKEIDRGRTTELLALADQNDPPGLLKDSLLAYSPYLSDTVMLRIILKQPPLPPLVLEEIISANSPLKPAVMQQLENRIPPLSHKSLKRIRNLQQGLSPMQELEGEISFHHRQYRSFKNEMIRRYLNDSTVFSESDSLSSFSPALNEAETLLAVHDEKSDRFNQVSLHLRKRQYAASTALLDSLEMTEGNTIQVNFKRKTIAIEQRQQKNYSLESDPQLHQELEAIAETDIKTKEPELARNILRQIFDMEWDLVVEDLVIDTVAFKWIDQQKERIQNPVVLPFTLYPNPAENKVYILYSDTKTPDPEYFYLKSLSGNTVYMQKLSFNGGLAEVSLPQLANGLYFVQIVQNQNILHHDKLVILHR